MIKSNLFHGNNKFNSQVREREALYYLAVYSDYYMCYYKKYMNIIYGLGYLLYYCSGYPMGNYCVRTWY